MAFPQTTGDHTEGGGVGGEGNCLPIHVDGLQFLPLQGTCSVPNNVGNHSSVTFWRVKFPPIKFANPIQWLSHLKVHDNTV